ncbi:MAG: hypothetical protein WCH39_21110 [Schlesneria sp.]
MNIGFINPRTILPFVIVISALTQQTSVGAEDDFVKPELVAAIPAIKAVPLNNVDRFPQLALVDHFFGSKPDTFQQRVETEIDQKVNKICLKFDLNESQRTKLFLAACHVKKEYFRQMDLLRQKWEAPQKDHMELFKIRDQVDTLRYQSLGPSTFFGKVLTRVLDEDASTIHQPNLNDRNFVRHCSNINSAVRIIERHVVLSAPQREALIELILKETRVPRFLGDYDDLIVQYRMSRLPDEKWQPLFSEDQWPGVRLAFEALRQCEPVLKRHGLINEEP